MRGGTTPYHRRPCVCFLPGMTSLRTVSLAALLLAASGALRPCAAQLEGGPAIGDRAPVVSITDLEGKLFDLGTLIGQKPVLLEFWATWCGPCNALMPSVDAAHARYGQQVAFVGINVSIGETPQGVRAWLAEHKPGFQVLYDSAGVGSRSYDIQATSTIIIIGSDGRVAYTGVGASQDISGVLGRLLAAAPQQRSN
jgi:cytochrome c biogenesis protein CcmG/thiol:disulfide interchange protein DsbE